MGKRKSKHQKEIIARRFKKPDANCTTQVVRREVIEKAVSKGSKDWAKLGGPDFETPVYVSETVEAMARL